jgi:WD40 repeat protein
VHSAAYSPNGGHIVTASVDRTARIWDAASGAEITALRGHEDWVLSAAYSSDGGHIVTASNDRTVRIWDAASGAEIARIILDASVTAAGVQTARSPSATHSAVSMRSKRGDRTGPGQPPMHGRPAARR